MARSVPNSRTRSNTLMLTVFATASPPTIRATSDSPKRAASVTRSARSTTASTSPRVCASSFSCVDRVCAALLARAGSRRVTAIRDTRPGVRAARCSVPMGRKVKVSFRACPPPRMPITRTGVPSTSTRPPTPTPALRAALAPSTATARFSSAAVRARPCVTVRP